MSESEKRKLFDPARVTPEGQKLGACMVRLTEPEVAKLVAQGEPDDRCKTCAFREGTIPNGCPQTQMDALKCVMEGVPFFCHTPRPNMGGLDMVCHGWYAATVALEEAESVGAQRLQNFKTPWPFSNAPDYSDGLKTTLAQVPHEKG